MRKTAQKREKKKLTQADIKKYSSSRLDHVILKIQAEERRYTLLLVLFFFLLICGGSYIVFSSFSLAEFSNDSLYITEQMVGNTSFDQIEVSPSSLLSDEQALNTVVPFEFQVENDGEEELVYRVRLIDDQESGEINKDYLRYSINHDAPRALSVLDQGDLVVGVLAPHDSITHLLQIWYSDAASGISSLNTYQGRIVVEAIS